MRKIRPVHPALQRLREQGFAGDAEALEPLEHRRIQREQVERLQELANARGVDLGAITKLSELAKLVPELQVARPPGRRRRTQDKQVATAAAVVREVVEHYRKHGFPSARAAAIDLHGYHQKFMRAKRKAPEEWLALAKRYKFEK